jgi:hypothetical protein
MEYEFKSLNELYIRIKPALRCKCSEFKLMGYANITESDIWKCLSNTKWISSYNLDLYTMVNNIFDLSIDEMNNYLASKVEI